MEDKNWYLASLERELTEVNADIIDAERYLQARMDRKIYLENKIREYVNSRAKFSVRPSAKYYTN